MKKLTLACLSILLSTPALAQDYRLRDIPLPEQSSPEPKVSLEIEDENANLEYEASPRLTLRTSVRAMERRATILRLSVVGDHLTVHLQLARP